MAIYRYQVVSVGWWRGKIKRWNTTFHDSQTSYVNAYYTRMQKTGWKNPGDVAGACSGGVASIAVYNASGGSPISNTVYFDWQTPSTWIPYTSEGWDGVDTATPLDASGESAFVMVGHLPGLSVTGKPMSTRKYFHAVPSRTAAAYTDPDVSAAVQTAMEAIWEPGYMLSPSLVSPSSTEAQPYYLNHQRVRGRRRTVEQVVAQSFSAGVVAGATSGGGASAPQFQ